MSHDEPDPWRRPADEQGQQWGQEHRNPYAPNPHTPQSGGQGEQFPGAYGQQPYPAQWGAPGFGGPPASGPKRPGTLLAGVIMSYVGAGVCLLFGILFLAFSTSAEVVERVAERLDNPVDVSALQTFFGVMGGIFLVLAVLVAVLAVFTQRRSNGARIALTVVGGLVVLGSIWQFVNGASGQLVGAAYIVVAVVLMWVGEANEWFRAKNRSY